MNLKAIADAIAGRFVGVTATNGSATESIVIGPTASLPNAIAKGPALLVFHPQGVLDLDMGKMRRDEYDFPVRFLRDPLNYPERSDWLYAWFDALRDRVEMDMDLGLAYVSWARLIDSTTELDAGRYAERQGGDSGGYDLIEFTVRVHVREPVPTVGI
jgi:hypothetical protein